MFASVLVPLSTFYPLICCLAVMPRYLKYLFSPNVQYSSLYFQARLVLVPWSWASIYSLLCSVFFLKSQVMAVPSIAPCWSKFVIFSFLSNWLWSKSSLCCKFHTNFVHHGSSDSQLCRLWFTSFPWAGFDLDLLHGLCFHPNFHHQVRFSVYLGHQATLPSPSWAYLICVHLKLLTRCETP